MWGQGPGGAEFVESGLRGITTRLDSQPARGYA
jgi:hypothetical protein